MIRDGLKSMLFTKRASMKFNIQEADTSEEAIEKSKEHGFHVVLMDYILPDQGGVVATREILKVRPNTKILAFSHTDELAYYEQMIAAGAKGYILKNVGPDQLIDAIKSILKGGTYFSSEVAGRLMASRKKAGLKEGNLSLLTGREIEVLKGIEAELTTKEIAEKLFISPRTVESHRQNIMLKLDAKNTAGLLKEAYKRRII